MINSGKQTAIGARHTANEDAYGTDPDNGLWFVADGMGGHASGEVASQMAVQTVGEFFIDTGADEEITWPYKMAKDKNYEENRLVNAVKLANLRIFEASSADPRKKGMGTTLVGMYVANGGCYLGHVGDSRIYRINLAGEMDQLTEDHSLLNDYIKMKNLTAEEIEHFPHKNVIVRALGMKDNVQVDIARLEPTPGDLYMLCSDGLSGMVTDPDMNGLMQAYLGSTDNGKADDVEGMCKSLIDAANANGGNDNVTAIAIKVV